MDHTSKQDALLLARQRINQIAAQMAQLFAERMDAVRQVAEYKKSRRHT